MFTAIIIYKLCCVPVGVMRIPGFTTLKACDAYAREYDRTGQNWNFRSRTHCEGVKK